MLDLYLNQSWLEKSSEGALEEFKSVFVGILNNFPEDRHTEKRWSISQTDETTTAHLIYDANKIASLIIEKGILHFKSLSEEMPRYDDVLYALRYAADKLLLAVFSNAHKGACLPQNYALSLDHTYFQRNKEVRQFFDQSDFIPRFAPEGIEYFKDGRNALMIYSPYYVESKKDGSIHIINNAMLEFLVIKEDQKISSEFSYKIADDMNDFARKYDLGIVPRSFYQSYGLGTKIINDTYFDVFHINRKVFIDPYVWDFDAQHDYRFYKNVENGMHFMDKVRAEETLDTALKRVLHEELQVSSDYVCARVWGIEFDRDKEGILTPRLKINIFVHGMVEKQRSKSHDWVSVK